MLAVMANLFDSNKRISQPRLSKQTGISQSRIAYAQIVLTHAPDLADRVAAGGRLDDAYEIVRKRRETEREEQKSLNDLRSRFADYAEKVDTGEWTLQEALAAEEAVIRVERLEREQEKRAQTVQCDSPGTALVSRGGWGWRL